MPRESSKTPFVHSPFLVVTAILLMLLTGCFSVEQNLVSGRKRAFGYTWAQEVQIGQEADPQIVAQYGLYDDEAVADYVTRLGQELLEVSHLRRPDTPAQMANTPFYFRVLDSPVVNAFALPGGYIYVTRGLLSHLQNEAQLAMVLGHEIGHVVGRHSSKRAATQQIGQLLTVGGALGAQAVLGGNAAQEVLNTGGTAVGLMFLSYGRDDERESDRLGVEYAAIEGFKSGEGAHFFRSLQRIQQKSGQSIPSFLSTHPDPGEREVTIQRLAEDWAQRVEMNRVGMEDYLDIVNGLTVGDDPRQGYVENGYFYHPVMKFQFPVPSGWQVINEPTRVVLVGPEQAAVTVFTLAQDANTAQAAGEAFAGQEGLTVIEQGNTRTNGLAAYNVLATAVSEQQEYQLLARYVELGGTVFSFQSFTLKTSFDTHSNDMYRSSNGFAQLNDRSKIDVQPTSMAIVPAPRSGTFQSFLPAQMPRGFEPIDFAIMNQVNLDTQIPRGYPLKLPR